MDAKEFLDYTQECISKGEFEKAIKKYKGTLEAFQHTSESCTMFLVFAIYEREKALGERSFIEGCSTVEDVINRYDQLKLYLRRYDFDVCYETTEIINFIKINNISSSAILFVAKTSMVDSVKVLNEVAMDLSEVGEQAKALKILTFLYDNSKDGSIIFNLSKLLYQVGEYETAKAFSEEITTITTQVETLKAMIQEKL